MARCAVHTGLQQNAAGDGPVRLVRPRIMPSPWCVQWDNTLFPGMGRMAHTVCRAKHVWHRNVRHNDGRVRNMSCGTGLLLIWDTAKRFDNARGACWRGALPSARRALLWSPCIAGRSGTTMLCPLWSSGRQTLVAQHHGACLSVSGLLRQYGLENG
jgi:hypothetical protein